MNMYMEFNEEEIRALLPYELICETMEGSRWNTGSVKRKFTAAFTPTERKQISRIKQQAHRWALTSGAPEKIKMTSKTYALWDRLGEFCYENA